jgi:hypothetical protein
MNMQRKIKNSQSVEPLKTVETLDGPHKPKKLGFWGFLRGLFTVYDMDIHQFERLEQKRTRHQIEPSRKL